MSSKVRPWQRFTRAHPCPICQGKDSDRRGRGERCAGFLSEDETTAFCMREEYAGALQPVMTGAGPAYPHRLDGPCTCGYAHGTFTPTPPTRRKQAEPKEPTWQRGSFPAAYKRGTYAAEWHYHDADGIRRYSVIRYDMADGGKEYPQARWRDDGHGARMWAWGLGETDRILYRLPELQLAPASRPVFVVEGEKCAEALRSLGLVATTCSEGAGKWAQVTGRHEALRGRHVIILPDHDEKGEAHARDVAADLAGVAASVRIVELPDLADRGDVADWLVAGGTLAELLELVIVSASPATSPNPIDATPGASATEALRARERALQVANERRRELETKDSWNQACKANPHLSATTKLVASAVRDELERTLERTKVPDDEELTVYLPKIAKRAGVSSQTAGEALKKLAEAGTIERRLETRIGAGGQKISRVKICPTELFKTPAKWKPPVPRNHGGKRCPHCGGSTFRVEQIVTCTGCGAIVERKVRIDELEAASPDAERPEELSTGSQLDFPIPEGNEKAGPVRWLTFHRDGELLA